jgi:hypothetical protein
MLKIAFSALLLPQTFAFNVSLHTTYQGPPAHTQSSIFWIKFRIVRFELRTQNVRNVALIIIFTKDFAKQTAMKAARAMNQIYVKKMLLMKILKKLFKHSLSVLLGAQDVIFLTTAINARSLIPCIQVSASGALILTV